MNTRHILFFYRILCSLSFQFFCFLLVFPCFVHANPLPLLAPRYLNSVDPSLDSWSEVLSGIGPLILLVGERSTKQHLSNVRSVHNAFSLSVAPLGLLAVVTSLLRLCGTERLRAFIGYDLEARSVAAVEMTRVNCGGVHAELVDGYLVRRTTADPSGTAIAVSILEGEFDDKLANEVVEQVERCEAYKKTKKNCNIPEEIAPVRWCMQAKTTHASAERIIQILEKLARINGVGIKSLVFKEFQTRFSSLYPYEIGPKMAKINDSAEAAAPKNKKEASLLAANAEPEKCPQEADCSVLAVEPGLNMKEPLAITTGDSEKCPPPPALEEVPSTSSGAPTLIPFPPVQLSFFLTFDAVSEFTTAIPVTRVISLWQGLISMIAIFILYFITLWQLKWHPNTGWILAVIGYLGIILGVMEGVLLICSSCENLTLNTRGLNSSSNWVDGIMVSVKNTDSMDTSGTLEAIWRKELTPEKSQFSSLVAILLVIAYICHYLGLRSSPWWVSAGELIICILSAFGRSMSKDNCHQKFTVVDTVKLDKRCSSTGLLRVQKAEQIPSSLKKPLGIDIRVYEEYIEKCVPMTGERIAWYVARQCIGDDIIRDRMMELTGLFLAVTCDSLEAHKRAVFVTFTGGILTEEGLAYPDTRMSIAFRCRTSDFAAPTSLLVRAIMRQPRWFVDHEELKSGTIPTGNVYIFSMHSIMSWWNISEDRNDMCDLQTNFSWPFLLVNIAFFMAILMGEQRESEVVETIEGMSELGGLERGTADGIVRYFKEKFA